MEELAAAFLPKDLLGQELEDPLKAGFRRGMLLRLHVAQMAGWDNRDAHVALMLQVWWWLGVQKMLCMVQPGRGRG